MRLFTIGDSMIAMNPSNKGPLKFNHTFQRTIGGAELNVAIGASRLGLETTFYSKVGKDEFGQHIINNLRGEGIDTEHIEQVSGKNTSVYFKQINADGSGASFYYRDNAPIKDLTEEDVAHINFDDIDYFHVSGVFVALLHHKIELIQSMIKKAQKANTTVTLDPNIRLKTWSKETASESLGALLPYTDILLTSDEELEILKIATPFENIEDLLKEQGLQEIIVKGGHLPTQYVSNEEQFETEVFPVSPIDTVGAGDGFSSGYLFALSKEYTAKERVRFANAVGGMVTEVIGDNEGLPYLEQVESFLSGKELINR
ncbi:sugar kinase [Mammaliicoccus sciuri]|uniref:sugar kinase n=1 Tax=Mammaliicoccus sciuri TaxID=1296 RepID=UPI000E68B4CB|nr:sugar kinase [Mammaliicoccus sciuri]RIN91487.1 sugar kinase [Mammaliicoccus sciuri]RIN94981.1 sugar kinase [Mammaliicoccus sciuri]